MTTTTQTRKELAPAYLFAVLLAPVAAHRQYLGDKRGAALMTGVWWFGWWAVFAYAAAGAPVLFFLVGVAAIVGAFIWWVVDLCLMPKRVQAANANYAETPSLAVPTP